MTLDSDHSLEFRDVDKTDSAGLRTGVPIGEPFHKPTMSVNAHELFSDVPVGGAETAQVQRTLGLGVIATTVPYDIDDRADLASQHRCDNLIDCFFFLTHI